MNTIEFENYIVLATLKESNKIYYKIIKGMAKDEFMGKYKEILLEQFSYDI